MTDTVQPAPAHPRQRHNFVFFGIDYISFALGVEGFTNLATVLPTFLSNLGATPTLVGAILSIYLLSWNIPQLFGGNLVARAPRKKPTLVTAAALTRPAVILFALYIVLTGAQPAWLTIIMMALALMTLMVGDSFAAVAWFDILTRAFPSEKRGGFISYWQVGKSVLLLGVAVVVRFVLSDEGPLFPLNYALLFGFTALMLAISFVAVTRIYEPPVPGDEHGEVIHISWREYPAYLVSTLHRDVRLRRITIARLFLLLSFMSNSFYILYATQELRLPEQVIAFYIGAQTVGALLASLFFGRIVDRHGSQRVAQIGSLILLTAPLLALVVIFSGEKVAVMLSNAYLWVYICVGLVGNILFLGYLNYVLDIAPANQRPLYAGITNTIGSVGLLSGVLGGWLLEHTSYTVLFSTTLALGLIAALMAFRLPRARPIQEQAGI